MKLQIPEIRDGAQKLIYICLAIILFFTLCIVLLAKILSPFVLTELFQSIIASVAVSLCGGLLFDIEIRNTNKN